MWRFFKFLMAPETYGRHGHCGAGAGEGISSTLYIRAQSGTLVPTTLCVPFHGVLLHHRGAKSRTAYISRRPTKNTLSIHQPNAYLCHQSNLHGYLWQDHWKRRLQNRCSSMVRKRPRDTTKESCPSSWNP